MGEDGACESAQQCARMSHSGAGSGSGFASADAACGQHHAVSESTKRKRLCVCWVCIYVRHKCANPMPEPTLNTFAHKLGAVCWIRASGLGPGALRLLSLGSRVWGLGSRV
eukprot:790944-Rhodomonas_salina.1